jgi:hypothetical protein
MQAKGYMSENRDFLNTESPVLEKENVRVDEFRRGEWKTLNEESIS